MITDEGSFIIIRVFFLPQVSIFQGSFSHTAEFSSSHWIYYCDIATTLGMNSWKEGKTILMDAEWRTFQEGNWRSFYYWSWVFSSSYYDLHILQKIIWKNSLCQLQLLCISTYGIECSTNTRQVLTQFNEAAVYVGVSYAEEKEDFIQQVVICCYPSPARHVYICTIIVSCWSVHIHVLVQF